LVFEDAQVNKRFVITRGLSAIIGNKEEYERLKPTAPYIPRPRTLREPEKSVVEGERPPAMGAVPYVVPLPKADIPARLAAALGTGSVKQILKDVKSIFLPKEFNSETYGRHFKYLAWIEEFRAECVLSRLDFLLFL
jgi:helicase MOV-10